MMTAGQFGPGPNVGMPPPPIPQHDNGMARNQHFPERNGMNSNMQDNNGPNQGGSGRPIDLRVILTRDEVAFLFGFDGMLLNQLRQQTGAHIQLTDGDSFEYVLLINGPIDLIFKAFSLVTRKLWDLLTNMAGPGHNRPLKIRIAVPAVQCGSIIGKAGAKVKEIRDLTGAQIQVSHDTLPNSSERCVEISGAGDQCVQCAYHVCCVMQDTPLRGEVMPYVPPVNNPQPRNMPPPPQENWRPVFLCGDKAFIIDGPIARPAPPELLRNELAKTPLGGEVAKNVADNIHTSVPEHMNPLALMAAIGKSQQSGNIPRTSREMTVNSEMIKVIMAQSQGQKLDEIKRMSGAQIFVGDQIQPNGDCLVTISGSEQSILLAQFLIQSNVDMVMKDRPPQQQQQQHHHQQPPPHHQHQPPPQQQQGHLNPTNQFDPSIMQQNFNECPPPGGPRPNFHQENRGGNFNNRNNFNENRFGPPGNFRGRGRGDRRSPLGDRGRGGMRGRGGRR